MGIQRLWHGTQSGWLPGIVAGGLGGNNPHDELATMEVLREMVKALEEHGVDLPGPAPEIAPDVPNELRLVAGTVPPVEYDGRALNFEYGGTYVSLQESVARMYATKFCGELYGYAREAALRLDAAGLRGKVPAWRGWGLIDGYNIPVMLKLPALPLPRFEAESGAKLSNRQRRMLSGTEPGGAFRATDLTFRLKGPVPADELTAFFVQGERLIAFCPRCMVWANPAAFPGIPAARVAFDPDAKHPQGIQLSFAEQAGCKSVHHKRR